MRTSTEEPSQAQRLAQEAEAGTGANNAAAAAGSVEDEKFSNESDLSPSNSTDAVAAVKTDDAEEPKRSKGKTALLMGALCMAVFLAALDMTIVTTALPTISAHFHSSQAEYTWIGSAYLLAAAAATPTWGSVLCAVSTSINMLLAGRVIQGIGGGGLIILVNICISDLFSIRNRGVYFGIIGMVWALASALGPVLGGVFTEYVSWRWCFYINLPVDGLAFVILLLFLDIETPKTPLLDGLKAIDWIGSLLVVGGTVMLLIGLEFGGVTFPWTSATVICLIVFGLVTIGIFFLNEWKLAKYPVMPLRLFKKRSNIAALLTCFVHGFVFISGSYFLPLYFQAVLGASPLLSGVYLFPFVLSLSFMSAAVGVFIRKTGQYLPPIWFGMFFMTLGFGLYIDLPSSPSWPRIIIFQIIAGIGVGPNFQSPLIALQSLVEPKDIATATATFGFCRNLATSISVVVGGVIFQNSMAKRESTLIAALGPQIGSELGGGSAGANTAIVAGLPPLQRVAATQAYTASLREMWIFYVAISAVGLVVSLAIGRQTLSTKHEVTKTGLAEQEKHRLERKERKSLDAGQKLKEEV